jgi:hypothetical protein
MLRPAMCVCACLLVAGSAEAAPSGLPARTLTFAGVPGRLGGPVGPIALDGRYAAYSIVRDSLPGCPLGARVYRLDLATGRSSTVSGRATCAQEQTSTGRGLFAIAVAGARTAWLVNFGGNTESGETLFASAGSGRDAVVVRSDRTGPDLDTLSGTEIGGLVSDGSRISYSTWNTSGSGALDRLPGPVRLAEDDAAVTAASADAGRVAVLRGDGSVAIFGIAGALLQTLVPANARAVALTGDIVAVLVKGGTVDAYDRTSGALEHAWPVAAGASTLDASSGIATYVAGDTVHVLDLLTGRDATVFAGKRVQVAGARIDTAGLLYAYDTRSAGKLVFTPLATVAKRLGR